MKRERYAWVSLVPAAWLLVCTLTAGWRKACHEDPRIGFVAHARRFSQATDRGQLLAPGRAC